MISLYAKSSPLSRSGLFRPAVPVVVAGGAGVRPTGGLGVINTNLEVLATASASPAPLSQAEREFLRRVIATRTFAIADFPVEPTNDRPTVTFGCAVLDWTGQQVVGAVFAAVDLNWFNP